MDTTTAAQQAGVTVATIRTWCRRNVIAAAKVAGRWVVDAASLAHRITLGRTRMETPKWAGLDGPLAVVDRDTAIALDIFNSMADFVSHRPGVKAAGTAIDMMSEAHQKGLNQAIISTPDYTEMEEATATQAHLERAAKLARWQAEQDREWYIGDLEELPA